jgi:hypothetical protein
MLFINLAALATVTLAVAMIFAVRHWFVRAES